MTTQEYIDKSKKNRSMAIDTYTQPFIDAIALNISNVQEEINYVKDILFKTGTYLGYDSIIDLYWNHLINLYTTGSIINNLTSTTFDAWDFDNYIYELDGTLKAPTSTYITDNSISIGSTSIYQDLIDFLGTPASSIGNVTDSGYATSALALAAMTAVDVARKGTGLRGQRTRDSAPASVTGTGPYGYTLGDGTIDFPDTWNATIYTKIDALLVYLSTESGYLNTITDFYTTIASNPYIIEPSVFTGIDSTLATFKANIETQITDLQSYKTNFELWDDDLPTNRAAINTALTSLVSDLNQWKTDASTRKTEIYSSGGTATIFGDPSVSGSVNSLREINMSSLVAFPDGLVETLDSLNSSSTALDLKITKEETKLSTFGVNDTEWIETPEVKSVYKKTTGIFIKWTGQFHCNKWKIYRRINDITNNDQWSEDYLIDTLNSVDDNDPVLNITYQEFLDTSSLTQGQTYIYRISGIDDYYSGISPCSDSSSLQSDIYINGSILPNVQITI